MNPVYRKNALDLEHKEYLELYRAVLVLAGSSTLGVIYSVYNTGAISVQSSNLLLVIIIACLMAMDDLKKRMNSVRESISQLQE